MTRTRAENNSGSALAVRNRRTKEIVGYKAVLPREFSNPPPTVKKPDDYQEKIGFFKSDAEARAFAATCIAARLKNRTAPVGADFLYYATVELAAREQQWQRDYGGDNAAARKRGTKDRSINRNWFSRAPFRDWRPATIGTPELQAWFDDLKNKAKTQRGKPVSASFLQAIKALTVGVFNQAGVSPNPAESVTVPEAPEPDAPYLEVDQIQRLCGAESISKRDRNMFACGATAGLRVGELLPIERRDVHLDDHDPFIRVRFGGKDGPTKSRRKRRVELTELAVDVWRAWLRDHYRGGRRVFEGPKGGYQASWPEKFQAWAKAAGVESMTSHIMRHTYAVAALNGSWGHEPLTMELVSQQLGHSSVAITERYYAEWIVGSAARELRIRSGRGARPVRPMTSEELFGIVSSIVSSPTTIQPFSARKVLAGGDGRLPPFSHEPAENKPGQCVIESATTQSLSALAVAVLEAARSEDPTLRARAVALADAVLVATDGPITGGEVVLPRGAVG